MNEIEYEFQVNIDGKDYGMDTLTSVNIKKPLFDKFDVGLACCACMTVSYRFDINPARGAKVIPKCRPKSSNDSWYQLGVFYIDLRTERAEVKTLTCYDSMMRADTPFLRDEDTSIDTGEWPRNMLQMANEIATRMGVAIDSRTVLNPNYYIDYPNDEHMRTLLQYIAAAHAGNWIITDDDKLLLVPMFSSMPSETHYLVTEYGSAIVLGRSRILV